jgi:exodeoxyribonuclease VII small subunit
MEESENLTYERAYAELKEIVEKIENEEIGIEELTKKLSRAAFLIKFCKEKLLNTQKEVENILEQIKKENPNS